MIMIGMIRMMSMPKRIMVGTHKGIVVRIKRVIIKRIPKIVTIIDANTTVIGIIGVPKKISKIVVVIAKAETRAMKTP